MTFDLWEIEVSKKLFSVLSKFFAYIFLGRLPVLGAKPSFSNAAGAFSSFGQHYQKHVLPHVYEFEEKRREVFKELRAGGFIALGLLAVVAAIVYGVWDFAGQFDEGCHYVAGGAVASVTGIVKWVCMPVTEYKTDVKEIVYPSIFSFFGPDFEYRRVAPLTASSLEDFDVLPRYVYEERENYVRGLYAGVGIELFELRLVQTDGGGKNGQTRTVFRGMVIILSMNKRFLGKTIIKKDPGALFKWTQSKPKGSEPVHLEDPAFEKEFDVFSSDQVEARYLLTPSFMDRLLRLAKRIGGGNFQCSFFDRKLLFMVPALCDRFQNASIFEPTTFVKECEDILETMSEIFGIIEYLKLDQRTGV